MSEVSPIIAIDARVPACAVVTPPARLATGTVEGLLEAVVRERAPAWRSVVLDMSRVESMSSSGVRFVLQLDQWCRRQGLWFEMRAPSAEARRVCDLAGLQAILDAQTREVGRGVEFDMPAEREVVGPQLDEIEAELERQGQPVETILRARLVLEELLLNVVDHGRPCSGRIEIHLARAASMLRLRIIDDGAPFDPFAAPLEEHPADIATRRIGGLGMVLVRQSCDWARYERRGDANVVEVGFLPPHQTRT
jgi:anti-anti-sigma factor